MCKGFPSLQRDVLAASGCGGGRDVNVAQREACCCSAVLLSWWLKERQTFGVVLKLLSAALSSSEVLGTGERYSRKEKTCLERLADMKVNGKWLDFGVKS